ncbi:adenosine deaminase 2-A-like isoform X1 [Neoarius graeffei]|uniref:adenosine deaminase 2-A-like isoform X1 n=1 Tax=Neoarius graeffei TaxID=443677 RepID=UPI00298C2397|nr:adenosine deaminase 2-A-like isoform X1 [Neoarius graeffei]
MSSPAGYTKPRLTEKVKFFLLSCCLEKLPSQAELYARQQKMAMRRFYYISCSTTALLTMLILASVKDSKCITDPHQRKLLLQEEASRQIGGRVELSAAEHRLDSLLRKLKEREIMAPYFPPAMHFFKAKPYIQRSPVFKILKKMPKGAILHIHGATLVHVKWLVMNVTYRPHCYVCFTWTGRVQFIFSAQQPLPLLNCSGWNLLENLRATVSDVTTFDKSLIRNLTLFTKDPDVKYPTQDEVWNQFEQVFQSISGLVSYAPVFKEYIYQGLLQLYNDNILYLEMRTDLYQTYELDGTIHDREWTIQTYKNVTEQFTLEYPDFIGIRLIYSVDRSQNLSMVKIAVRDTIEMQKRYPEIIAGFDLVGQEDKGNSIWYFRDALSIPAEVKAKLSYFFHAGETGLYGTDVDGNILDALYFNTTRIGHGFALARHPLAKELSRKLGVPVEVCPISNQVLKLVSDLRNHPAAVLMSEGHPMVVSSDDPALFGTSGLTYDFYEVFVGIGGLSANVGTLKELAMNSIRYSSLPAVLKDKAMALWQQKWSKFISKYSP